MRDDMSEEAKQNARGWLNGTWQQTVATLAQNRNIEPQALDLSPANYIEKYKQAKGE
ncbi:protease 4 [Mannheimia haemolytica]|uniref:Protease 4 n=1 Tax=Mannheimia haemolytica TaxID=75985 RepID=A0A378MW47_MANHA|nr:protease 4 [Mannheimia haemolytica]